MVAHILFNLFEKSPYVKIFLFMLPGADTADYSLSEIARGAELSLSTTNRIFPKLIEGGYIIRTRKVGKSILYQLNLRNAEIADLADNYNGFIQNKLRDHTQKATIREEMVLPALSCERESHEMMKSVVISQSA